MLKKLPFRKEEASQNGEEGESLTTILETPEERGHLTLLIGDATEAMRKKITDAFDPTKTGYVQELPVETTQDSEGGEDDKVGQSQTLSPEEEAQQEEEKEKKRLEDEEKRRKEVSTPAMVEFKHEALMFFDDWRDSVYLRVGEIVNSRDDENKPKKPSRSDSSAKVDPAQRLNSEQQRQEDEMNKTLQELYPPLDTPLSKLAREKRALIVHSVLLLLLSLEHYNAHSRVLMLHILSSLNLSISQLAQDETQTSKALLSAAKTMSADEETKQKAEANTSRKWKVGLAAVGGAVLIGITGGLAAPLLAAGIGSVMGGLGLAGTAAAGYLGALAGSSVLIGGLFGAYGGRMTSKMMDKYAKEVQDFAFIPVQHPDDPGKVDTSDHRLRVAIGISGWLTSKDDVADPWAVIAPSIEGFALRYELESLLALGNSMTTMVRSAAWGVAKTQIIKHTVFGALAAGLWPLGLMKAARIIDNPFSVAKARGDKAGEVLADAIINKAQGERPLTLVGYSLGARVIYTCLMELAKRKAFGLIESVVFIGAPMPSTAADWRKIRSVVSGRVVNVFSTNDYILAFLYRTSSIQYGIAGLQAIQGVEGIENVDVSDMVNGHTTYRYLAGSILRKIGFEDISVEEVKKEEEELKEEQEKEEQERKDHLQSRKAKGEVDDDDEEVNGMEAEVEKKNQETKMAWASEKLNSGRTAVGNAWNGVTGRRESQAPKRKSISSAKQQTMYEGT